VGSTVQHLIFDHKWGRRIFFTKKKLSSQRR